MKEAELIANLESTDVSLRLGALQWAIDHGCPPAVLEAVRARVPREQDDECRLFLAYVLRAAKHGSPAGKPPPDPSTPFAQGSDAQRLEFLLEIRTGRRPPPTQDQLITWLKREPPGTVLAQLIRVCGTTLPEADLPFLERHLATPSISVRLAAAEVLFHRDPVRLVPHLPGLLVSGDLRLRLIGLEALVRLDPEEALLHVRHLLLEGQDGERLAGLQTALLLPFDEVKGTLLQFLAISQDPDTIDQACLFFQINPDPESPFRLYEILENSSPGPKRDLLRQTIREAGKALEISGVLGDALPAYLGKLQAWVDRKIARRIVRQCLRRLAEPGEDGARDVAALLQRESGRPFLRETVAELPDWPLAEPERAAADTLGTILAGAGPLPSAAAAWEPGAEPGCATEVPFPSTSGTSATADPSEAPERRPDPAQPEEEIIPRLALWPEDRGEEIRPVLQALITSRAPAPRLLAAAFRSATRLGLAGFDRAAHAALRQPPPELVDAALEYLGRFDFDGLMPHLGRFLTHAQGRVRTAALNLLKQQDPVRAVGAVFAMLRRDTPADKHLALTCLIHFDFSLIREPLVDFLRNAFSEEAFQEVLTLFEANPDPDNLYQLFRMERLLPPTVAPQVRDTRTRCEAMLIEGGLLPAAEKARRLAAMESLWEKECARRQGPPKPYSVKVLRAQAARKTAEEGSARDLVAKALGFSLAAGLAMLGTTLVFVPLPTRLPPAKRPADGAQERITGQAAEVTGRFRKIDRATDRWQFQADDGRMFLLPVTDVDATTALGRRVTVPLIVGSAAAQAGTAFARMGRDTQE